MEKTEIWKAVPGYEGRYEVSDLGRVRNVLTGYTLNPTTTRFGYRMVVLKNGTSPKSFRVHTLVLLAFAGPKPNPKSVSRHLNGVPGDDRAANLAWGYQQENSDDSKAHGTRATGSRCGSSKLSEETAAAVRYASGLQREIAARYGISQSAVSRIKSGENWPHV